MKKKGKYIKKKHSFENSTHFSAQTPHEEIRLIDPLRVEPQQLFPTAPRRILFLVCPNSE